MIFFAGASKICKIEKVDGCLNASISVNLLIKTKITLKVT
jgi:hypothetical protein